MAKHLETLKVKVDQNVKMYVSKEQRVEGLCKVQENMQIMIEEGLGKALVKKTEENMEVKKAEIQEKTQEKKQEKERGIEWIVEKRERRGGNI